MKRQVMITVNKTEEGTIIVVKDEGIGIERSELPRLFEDFIVWIVQEAVIQGELAWDLRLLSI